MKRPRRYRNDYKLNADERRDILLWFGWGALLDYPTTHRDYLRAMLRPDMRAAFLAQPRPLRRAILRFVIDEHARRHARRIIARMKFDYYRN